MLVLNGLEYVQDDALKDMLVQFRKVQVSRYPLELYKMSTSRDMLGFIDSRFPTDRMHRDSMAAMIWTDEADNKSGNAVTQYCIESRLIRNEKYASHNSDYYIKKTTDPKKFFKYLKEYVKPFAYQEVALRSMRSAENKHEDWRDSMRRDSYVSVTWEDVMEEVVKLHNLGVQPQTDKFKIMYEKNLHPYLDYKAVKNKTFKRIHVLTQADGTVAVTAFADYMEMEKGSTLYEEMDQVPKHIQEQVGMLRMMTIGDFVPSVGVKVGENEFWVEGLSQ